MPGAASFLSGLLRQTQEPGYPTPTLLSGSLFTGIAYLSIALWRLMVPFAEEPWLAQQFGAEYEEFRGVAAWLSSRKSP
jgi:hypothetical protein